MAISNIHRMTEKQKNEANAALGIKEEPKRKEAKK